MAILIEQDKKSVNWVAVAIALVVIVVIFSGAYFLFFKKPELIDVVSPTKLKELESISTISFDPDTVLTSPTFKTLQQYDSPITPTQTPGKANPFSR